MIESLAGIAIERRLRVIDYLMLVILRMIPDYVVTEIASGNDLVETQKFDILAVDSVLMS
jgi:hypothetical protein